MRHVCCLKVVAECAAGERNEVGMPQILLIRHGVKQAVQGDVPLTSLGRRQAKATAQYLAGWPIQAVHHLGPEGPTFSQGEAGPRAAPHVTGCPVLPPQC
jgi:hypothetical protein